MISSTATDTDTDTEIEVEIKPLDHTMQVEGQRVIRHGTVQQSNAVLSKNTLNRSREHLCSLVSRIQLLHGSHSGLQRDFFLHRQPVDHRNHRYRRR